MQLLKDRILFSFDDYAVSFFNRVNKIGLIEGKHGNQNCHIQNRNKASKNEVDIARDSQPWSLSSKRTSMQRLQVS